MLRKSARSPFNSRPHEEVDQPQAKPVAHGCPFNSRPHEEVDLMYSGKSSAMRPFNSRPHEEVDRYEPVTCCIICLSIHDLTRRSTTRCLRGGRKFILSIHDLTRRSTPVYNPVSEAVQLSIHDLTRRSTLSCLWHLLTRNLSIHDLTRRSTVCHLHADFRGYFQFTTSRGGRPYSIPPLRHDRPFNSRPHEEVDKR